MLFMKFIHCYMLAGLAAMLTVIEAGPDNIINANGFVNYKTYTGCILKSHRTTDDYPYIQYYVLDS